jgi:AbrB family looped-hinge helix DNA binding protein
LFTAGTAGYYSKEYYSYLMRLTEKGQVTIPQRVRERLGLRPGDEVDFVVEGDTARIVRHPSTPSRGRQLVSRLRGQGDVAMSTDEIMALTRGE